MNQSSKNTCQKNGISKKKLQSVPMTVLVVKIHFPNFRCSGNFHSCFKKKHVGYISDLTWTCVRLQSEEPPICENRLQFTACQLAINYLCFFETNHCLLKVRNDMCLLIESKKQHPRTERTESKLHRPLQKNKLSFVPITGSWHVIRDMFLWQHSPPIPSVCSKFSHFFVLRRGCAIFCFEATCGCSGKKP